MPHTPLSLMRKLLFIITTLATLTACTNDATNAADGETINVSVTAAIETSKAASRVTYTPNATTQGLDLAWEADDHLGVYIKQANGIYKRAGQLTSTAEPGTGTRTFTGNVVKLQSGEKYYYIHPDHGTAIDFANQRGELGSTDHLRDLIPLLWEGPTTNDAAAHYVAGTADNRGYAIHLSLSFNENPGTIQNISIQTMDRGSEDKVFASRFVPANMAPDDLVKTITLRVTGGNTVDNGDGTYTADAYLACSHKDVDVFASKFNVRVTSSNGTFLCDYRSFPGQESISGSNPQLQMVADGKCYNVRSTMMSKAPASTLINSIFGVYSLLGMWNTYGECYDPSGCIVKAESQWPEQLSSNKSAILDRYQDNGTGTPTFLSQLYHAQNDASADGHTQSNVAFNNIQIVEPTEVYVTFVSEYGWNQNSLGYYYYPSTDGTFPYLSELMPQMRKTIIWPNFSKPYHEPFNKQPGGNGEDRYNIGQPADAPLREFETVRLLYTDSRGYSSTIFPAGTTIGFVMMIDTKANQEQPKNYSLLDWQQWRIFTNSAWNAHNTTLYIQSLATANGIPLPDGFKPNGEWTGTYLHQNFFASGDVCNGTTPIPGLAIYGVKDKANDLEAETTAYGAMIYMVSTSNPAAMRTQNRASFNIGTGDVVINHQ